ncbi:hypothetical protein DXG01_010557 [Tephrocybe rancida]|nr:hypothetical protein DXG01_010557 [Tephrocybe rancida]
MHPTIFVALGLFSFSLSAAARRDISLAKRATLTDDNGVVRVDALRSELARGANKVQRGFAAYEKNTGSMHPSSRKSLSKRQTTSIELTSDDNTLWYGEISVGTPEQKFTGSTDLFLPSAICTSRGCNGHRKYSTDDSSSAVYLGEARDWALEYADSSSVAGRLYNDTVKIGAVTALNQAVGAATEYSDGLGVESFPPDGLLGMAFEKISAFHAPPLTETLFAQKQLDVSQFGFKLASPSELSLGGINFDLIDADTLVWTPVTQKVWIFNSFTLANLTRWSSKGYWQVAIDNITVNDIQATSTLSAIIDTGSSIIHGSPEDVAQFYRTIPGAKDASETAGKGFYTYPCNAVLDIKLTVDSQPFVLKRENFNLGQVSPGSSECVGGIAANDDAGLDNAWLIGDVFLLGVYTVFEFGQAEVGFANLQS